VRLRIPIIQSVLVKLVAILLVTGLVINMLVFFFFGAIRHFATDTYNGHLLRYIDYLVSDMGTPPNPDRAREIAADTGMVIGFASPTYQWTTGPIPPEWQSRHYRVWYQAGGIEAGSRHGNHFVHVVKENGRYTFALPFNPRSEKKIKLLGIGLLLLISLLLVMAMLLIRRILRPLSWLQQGVERVGEGDLDYIVKTRGKDELHNLARAFNEMTGRLKAMIKIKDRLLVDVSHELRSPITRMKVALEFLTETTAKKSIAEDLGEMETMVTGILDAARTENARASLKREPTDLVRLTREVVKAFETGTPNVIFDPPSKEIRISADPGQIRTALKNIIENGQKYSAHQTEPVTVAVSQDSAHVVLTIRDRGIGIPAGDLTRIFEPFYRVDKSRTRETGGFGLGLSICKNIIEAHGGGIDIVSPDGKGTVVKVTLPI